MGLTCCRGARKGALYVPNLSSLCQNRFAALHFQAFHRISRFKAPHANLAWAVLKLDLSTTAQFITNREGEQRYWTSVRGRVLTWLVREAARPPETISWNSSML